ncbi:hypothetical protein FAI40_07975 [Acetobacteraceae bacterium]|nr:hypothetical protein FAI40_07975 [Acetobacteraceae bacterium]
MKEKIKDWTQNAALNPEAEKKLDEILKKITPKQDKKTLKEAIDEGLQALNLELPKKALQNLNCAIRMGRDSLAHGNPFKMDDTFYSALNALKIFITSSFFLKSVFLRVILKQACSHIFL